MEDRKLTDADIEALARELRRHFYENIGKGVWAMVWKAVVLSMVAIAAYGSIKGWR